MRCIAHEPCPNCGSRDNVGVWEDGHKWCFGCGYYKSGTNGFKRATGPLNEGGKGVVLLPEDIEPYYPFKCVQWVNNYELTENDLRSNQVVWSEAKKLLIFPYRSDPKGPLLAWQGRNFGDVYSCKWFGRGNLEDVFSFKGLRDNKCVVVEDIISAIVLGKAGYYALPLFGSHLSDRRIIRLKLMIDHLFVWLDRDKAKEAHSFAKRSTLLGLTAQSIITDKDPKCYTKDSIKEFLQYEGC